MALAYSTRTHSLILSKMVLRRACLLVLLKDMILEYWFSYLYSALHTSFCALYVVKSRKK